MKRFWLGLAAGFAAFAIGFLIAYGQFLYQEHTPATNVHVVPTSTLYNVGPFGP